MCLLQNLEFEIMVTPFNPVLKDGIIYRDQWEVEAREKVIAEARSWLGTPYHKRAQVKGAGCDCATFIYAVYHTCGLIPDEEIEIFSDDWSMHTSDEVYMRRIMRHAEITLEGISYPTLKALPGNIVLTKTDSGRVYDHGGIVTDWPRIIHAVPNAVEEANASQHWLWEFKMVKIFDPWRK